MASYVSALAARAYAQHQTSPIAALAAHRVAPRSVEHLEQELAVRPDLQDQLAVLTGYSPSAWVIEQELDEIGKRRADLNLGTVDTEHSDPLLRAFHSNLIGLACSGGGIRSASFNLGVLQELARLDLLRHVDYLCSVSGGGYIHQWLAAWLRRFSPGYPGATAATPLAAFTEVAARLQPAETTVRGVEAPQLQWLRRYSNYLTPRQGFFTADTWVAAATWIRNTLLNQVTLITAILLMLLVPHLLAPPPGVRVNPPPPMTHEANFIVGAMAVVLLVLLGFVTLMASANLSDKFAKTAPMRLLDDAGVQLFLVLPLVTWALLVTLVQEVTGPNARPTVVLVLTGVVGLTVMGAALAFRGGALRTFAQAQGVKSLPFREQRAVAGVILAVTAGAAIGSLWTIVVPPVVAEVLTSLVRLDESRIRMIVGPPLVLLGPMIGVIVLVGLLGRMYQEQRREWLSRFTAWGGMYAALWAAFVGIAFAARPSVDWLAANASAGIPSLLAWIGMTSGGVLAGKSAETSGGGSTPSKTRLASEWVAGVAPYVFVLGLLLLVGWFAERAFVAASDFGVLGFILLFAAAAATCVVFAWRVDVNAFSMHAFYRNRLARCYLAASNQKWNPNPFIAMDPEDTKVPLADLRATTTGYPGPYPIFCATLNLSSGQELAWQERKAASFVFTPLYCGYDVPWTKRAAVRGRLRPNGYAQTERYAYDAPGVHIGTVAAISGAAVSPAGGYHTNPVTAFLMTVFNVRLGWWLLNPRVVTEDGYKLGARKKGRYRPTPEFALSELVKELLGSVDDTRRYVYLTDGGHFDNMGLYELVRRRCRFIIVCDAEEDGEMRFEGIAMAIRKCRADFGVEVDLDLRTLDRNPATGLSTRHVVIGTIHYPGILQEGTVVYIKSSLTGDEPADVLGYHRAYDGFPHQSTLDQWFSESQFESYRRLGLHITRAIFSPAVTGADYAVPKNRQELFRTLLDTWLPPTPEMQAHQSAHAERYNALLSHIRTEPHLNGLLERLYEPGPWMPGKTQAEVAYAVCFTSELLEFMRTVYTDLNLVLPSNAAHPHSQGWTNLFRKCGQIDVIQEGWRKFGPSYSAQFRHFAIKKVGLPELP